jgi:hypothetical protein
LRIHHQGVLLAMLPVELAPNRMLCAAVRLVLMYLALPQQAAHGIRCQSGHYATAAT